jgi:hypothetical protein
MRGSRFLVSGFGLAAALGLTAVVAAPAAAQTASEAACRSAIAKASARYTKTVFKVLAKCHASRSTAKRPLSTDCNDADTADTGKLSKARTKLQSAVTSATCNSNVAMLAEYSRCPSPAAEVDDAGATDGIDDYGELSACLIALTDRVAGQGTRKSLGLPPVVPTPPVTACQKEIGKRLTKVIQTIGKERARCQSSRDAQSQGLNYGCAGADPKQKIAKALNSLRGSIAARCNVPDPLVSSPGNELIDVLDACGDTADQLQDCVGDVVAMRFGSGLIAMAYELPDTCRVGSSRRTIFASAGRQLTPTRLDAGWTGQTHGVDIPDLSADALTLGCNNDCAECSLSIDPLKDTPRAFCRCAGAAANSCDTINGPDTDDCGAVNNVCQCYFGPPLSISSGGTPVCVVNQIRQDYEGTVDVGTGQWRDRIRLASLVHLGISTVEPCPTCQDDVTPNDGVRDGTCQGGLLAGTGACDVNGIHPSFGPSSLDCPPNPITNVSGGGLLIDLKASNEPQSLPFSLPCDAPPAGKLCPCRVCSGNANLGCSSDADCAEIGAGTCTAGGGAGVKQNQCADGVCSSEGLCDAGPVDSFCDGALTPKGEGYLPCSTDTDCSVNGAGACTVEQQRRCHTDPIVVGGTPGTYRALSGAIFCIPPTTSSVVNSAGGLPGAGRISLDFDAEPRCANEPDTVWEIPGGANCTPVTPTTTTTLIPPIGCNTLVPPLCGGGTDCGAGNTCQDIGGGACGCAADPGGPMPCGGAFPVCGNGTCPAGQTCQLDIPNLTCNCTVGTACADTMFPICGGTCPGGQTCQGNILGLACACGP